MTSASVLNSITQIISENMSGATKSFDSIFEALYPQIKRLAESELYKLNPGQQLSPTMLANECYLKLKKAQPLKMENRQHFYNIVSRCMRYYLVDLVRNHNRQKRKGDHTELKLSQLVGEDDLASEMLDLEEALSELELIDEKLAILTQMRFFMGMSLDEIAELNQTTRSDVYKQWVTAKSLLLNLLEDQKKSE